MSLPARQEVFSLEDLRLLAALAETGSLAAAARQVRVNHASAWRRLGALEGRLGVRLFDRHRTGYAATPAGEEAIAVARHMLAELEALERRLAGRDIRPSGIVRLTTTDTLLALVLPVVARLRATHPGLVAELVTDNGFFTLTRRDADIALRPASAAPEGLVARRLGTVATAVYASARYRETRAGDPLALDWLAPDDSLSHLGSARWIADKVAPERIVYRASSLLALAAAARAGIGLAPLPCVIADPDPGLVRVMPPLAEMATSLWLLTHPDLRSTARVRVVLDALAEQLKAQRGLLAGQEVRGL
ncbi:LysR family transcriptional regulator [Roseomonas hellenica]|nr:LysR family transcriptional regulator [Plastoroseomonas hellenica]